MNNQPKDSLTIRDSATRKIITTAYYGSRAVMFREARGLMLGEIGEIGFPVAGDDDRIMAAARAAGAQSVDVADEYVY